MPPQVRVEFIGYVPIGQPVDIGWATAVLHADGTFTRTCKGCGVVTRSPIGADGRVAEARILHAAECPVMLQLEHRNNPIRS